MLEWTGIGRYSRQLLAELAALDDDNEYVVFVRSSGAHAAVPAKANFEVCVAEYRPYGLAEQRHLPRVIRALRPDIVHFPHFNVPLAYRDPFVVTVHDLTMARFSNVHETSLTTRLGHQWKYPLGRSVTRSSLRRAAWVLTGSNATAEALRAFIGRDVDDLTVTYYAAGILTDAPVRVPGLDDGRPFLLYVGNFYPYKNVDLLVQGLKELILRIRGLRLVLVGPADHFQNSLRRRAEASQLRDHVVFTGHVTDGELRWLYETAALFAFPSLSEGFGLPGLEAMSHGLPVLASDSSALPEVYGAAAAYFDPHDVDAFVGQVEELMEDSARRKEMAHAGAARVKQFSWRHTAQLTLDAYRRAGAG